MPRVLVAGKLHERGLAVLRNAPGIELDYVEAITLESYVPYMAKADALLVRTQPVTADVIAGAHRLQIVSRHGVGYDAVDLPALNARKIPLTVVGDVNARPVAEHTLLMLLAAAKRLPRHDAAMRSGDWNIRNQFAATELDGKRLLIVGFGRVGRLVAAMAKPFGMSIAAYDPFQAADMFAGAGVERVADLQAALPSADFITLHVPKTGDGPLLGAAELARLKPGVVIINTARGGLIDEAALAAALDNGTVAAAGLDVFETEPPTPGNGLFRDQRIVLTPHIAGLTQECAIRMAMVSAQNILDHFAGKLRSDLVVNRVEIGMA